MALSKGIAYTTIVIGIILLALTAGLTACGGIALNTLNEVDASLGLWGIYLLIPAILSLVAGIGGYRTVFAITLSTHILGILVALAGLVYASVVWAILDSTCTAKSILTSDFCSCVFSSTTYIFAASCSNLTTVRDLSAAVTILYMLSFIVCLVGSILGCAGACCIQRRDYRRKTVDPPYVLPYYPEPMMMTSLEERRYHGQPDPYPREAIYHHGPYMEERPYIHDKPRHSPFIEGRPYMRDQPYYHAKPLTAPTHRLNPLYAGRADEVTDGRSGLYWAY